MTRNRKVPTVKQTNAIKQKHLRQINELWPDTPQSILWDRSKAKGFATIPKTLPLVMRIIDILTLGRPASSTYFTLWANNWDVPIVEISREGIMAWESGFSGTRAANTWRIRMDLLKKHKLINCRDGSEGKYNWVLIHNPHAVVRYIKESKPDEYVSNKDDFDRLYMALKEKCSKLRAGEEFEVENESWMKFCNIGDKKS
jgi:hypothetical protein